MQESPKTVYHNLRLLEEVDVVISASFRQSAQDALADPEVSLTWKQVIANRLNQANHRLEMQTATENDSY